MAHSVLIPLFFIAALYVSTCMSHSVMLPSPELRFHPGPSDSNSNIPFIWYDRNKDSNVRSWVERIDKFIEPYLPGSGAGAEYGPCSRKRRYNYYDRRGGPCVFFDLFKGEGWMPEYYNTTYDLPAAMPEEVRKNIRDFEGSQMANTLWMSCAGDTPADVENVGTLAYYPTQGFPGHTFSPRPRPHSHLAALHVVKPIDGVMIRIKCQLWARNIDHARGEGQSSLHVMVD